jgi:hypothetical protein
MEAKKYPCVATSEFLTCGHCHQDFQGIHRCPESQEYHDWCVAHLRRMGVGRGWVAPFNVERNGELVLRSLPDVDFNDWVWLCNQVSSIHKKWYPSVDNVRLCRVTVDQTSIEYQRTKDRGCCLSFDRMLVNKRTGSVFFYGFNYGH